MNEKLACLRCGAVVPANAPEGLCPRCLATLNLEPDTVVTGAEAVGSLAPPPASELAPLFPQLELLGLIGRGGMGAVYKARQKELDRIVALKVLPPGIGSDPAFAERFAREAKALARLNHPGIVTVHDFGRANGLFYFLMEFVDGVSLRQLMSTSRVSAREALAIVPQICDALQYAHDQGIVHRDIKPENILLDRQGRVKVADFGLAKLMGEGRDAFHRVRDSAGTDSDAVERVPTSLTAAGKVMGTPQYMAPEQAARPGEVDHRADIYALGMVFYQMLTGELPGQRIEPPSRKVHIDVRLDEVVLRALEKEPERRYQQVSEVKTAVETIAGSAAEQVPPAPVRTESWEAARRRTRPVATALLWLGVCQLIPSVLLGIELLGKPSGLSFKLSLGDFGEWPLHLSTQWGMALSLLLPIIRVLFLLVVVGAFRMRHLESYGLAVAAALLAMITPPLVPIGLPLGAWALSILVRKEVHREFGKSVPASGSTLPGVVPHFSRLAIASVILTIASILGNVVFAGIYLYDPVIRPHHAAGLVGRLVLSLWGWIWEWPMLGTVLLAAVALEDVRRGRWGLRGAGLAVFGLLCLPLLIAGRVLLLGPVGFSAPLTQGAGLNLMAMLLAVVLSAGAAFWVAAQEARRRRAGQTGAGGAWRLLSKPAVRCLQVMAFALPIAFTCLQPVWRQHQAHSPPTVEQILTRYARAKGDMAGPEKTRTLTVKGSFTSRDGLKPMEAEMFIKAPDKWTQILKNANGPVWQRAFDGSVAWEASPWSGPTADAASVALAPYLIALFRGDSLAPLLPKMSFKGREPIGGGQAYVVEVAVLGQLPRLWFDMQTGLLVRIECRAGSVMLQMDWDDYRDVGGLLVPFKIRQAGTENWTIQCTEVKLNEPIDDARFARPASH